MAGPRRSREVLGQSHRSRHPAAEGARGSGEGTNPEQLFSAGYAACFLSALQLIARGEKVALDGATGITAQVGFGKDSDGGFGINAHLIGYLPGLEQGQAEDLMLKAHQVCPYSKATRGNIDVTLAAKV